MFCHIANGVYHLRYSNGDTLGVTGTHPLYSLDRQQFISTEEIQVGEHLLSKSGIITVVSKTYDPTPQEVYNLEVGQWHNFLVGVSGVVAHNYCIIGNADEVVSTFSREGALSGEIRLLEGIERPTSSNGHGLIHILERHSVEYYPTHSKGALFPANTSIEHISDGIKEVYKKGTRVSEVGKPVQTFEKRIKLNGESSNYRLIVDNNNKYVVSFFKITE